MVGKQENRTENEIQPEKDVKRVKFPNMIQIPGGELLMGTSDDNVKHLQIKESDWAYDWYDNDLFSNEQPQHIVKLKSFQIAQFPVTNEEYYNFIWDTGYRLPRN